jgi:hypothetical protein
VMLASFTSSAWIAVGGFLLMLASAGWFAMSLRKTNDGGSDRFARWLDRARQRWSRNS